MNITYLMMKKKNQKKKKQSWYSSKLSLNIFKPEMNPQIIRFSCDRIQILWIPLKRKFHKRKQETKEKTTKTKKKIILFVILFVRSITYFIWNFPEKMRFSINCVNKWCVNVSNFPLLYLSHMSSHIRKIHTKFN